VTVKQHTNKQPLTHTHTHTLSLSLSLSLRQCLLQYNAAQNTRSLSGLHTNVYALDQKPTLKKKKAKPNQKDANTDEEQQGWTKLKNPRLRFTVTKETMNNRGGMSGEHTRKQTQEWERQRQRECTLSDLLATETLKAQQQRRWKQARNRRRRRRSFARGSRHTTTWSVLNIAREQTPPPNHPTPPPNPPTHPTYQAATSRLASD
jgi:hypothetical protein